MFFGSQLLLGLRWGKIVGGEGMGKVFRLLMQEDFIEQLDCALLHRRPLRMVVDVVALAQLGCVYT